MARGRFLILAAVLLLGIGVSLGMGVLGNPFAIVGYRPPARSLAEFPLKIAGATGWVGRDQELPDKALEIAGMDEYLNRWYRSEDGRDVQLFVSYYGNVGKGIDSIYHNPTICFPAQGWREVETVPAKVKIEGSELGTIPVSLYRFQKGIRERIVLNFFILNGRVLERTPRDDPLELARGKLTLGSDPGYYVQVQVVAEVRPGDGKDITSAAEFLTAAGRHIFPLF